jgi:[methyl-Co(III) methanol-specific corrinoid protein]:coenzyme M methyltransferase
MLGGKTDRIPVGNVVSVATIDQMRWLTPGSRAHTDPEVMAQLAAAGHMLLGYDTVMPVFSVTQEAFALGCEVDWGKADQMPTVRSNPFAHADDFSLPDGWLQANSIQVVLKALRLLREKLGDQIVIVGKVMGPWTLSYHMMGMEEFLISTKLDLARAYRSMEVL